MIQKLLYWFFYMPCLFQLLTGLYCPGCGGTRAVKALLRGDINRSLYYHPIVVYTIVVVAVAVLSKMVSKVTGNPKWYLGHEKLFIYLGCVILIGNWIFKNYFLVVKGIELL